MSVITIRPELPKDHCAIYQVTQLAFEDRPYAAGDEQALVGELREQGALVLSLVAERDQQIVGQITFSPAYPTDGTQGWYALGPVSVLPQLQSQGIGADLINRGLDTLRDWSAAGCVLTGNPVYYTRFGFSLAPAQVPPEESAEHFMLKTLSSAAPKCAIGFHKAFYGDA